MCIAQFVRMSEITRMRESDLSILVADENRLRAGVIEDALHEAGYARVVVVHEIMGLVRRIEETAPDVIVIDIENPNRDAIVPLSQSESFAAASGCELQIVKGGGHFDMVSPHASAFEIICQTWRRTISP